MFRQFIYSFFLRISLPLFGVLNFMMIVRLFDKELVGTWVLYMTLLGLVEVLKNGFIKNATIMLLNGEYSDRPETVLSSSLFLNGLITLVAVSLIALLLLIFHWLNIYPVFSSLLFFYCVQLILFVFFSHFEYYLSAKVQFKMLMVGYLIRNSIFFLFLGVFYLYFQESLELHYLVGFQTIGMLVSILFLKSGQSLRLKIGDRSLVQDIVKFGKYTFATNASSTLFRSTDHYMLAGLIGNGAVANYNVALRITNLVDLPSTATAEVLFPLSVKSDRKRELYEQSVGYILALVILASVVIFIFSEFIVVFIAGSEYQSSIDILKVTLVYGLLLPFLRQFGTMIDAMNLPKVNFYVMFSTFSLNLIFNYFFIAEYGSIGAAYGTLTSYVFSFVVIQIILYKKLGVRFVGVLLNVPRAYFLLIKKVANKTAIR